MPADVKWLLGKTSDNENLTVNGENIRRITHGSINKNQLVPVRGSSQFSVAFYLAAYLLIPFRVYASK